MKTAVAKKFDLLSVVLHWSVALLVIGLFPLGLWMVDLGYYDDWYYRGPWWHTSLGVVVLALVVLRWLWSKYRNTPAPIASIPVWQHQLASLVHSLMTLLLILICITGYFMVTGKGDALAVFDLFAIPSVFKLAAGQIDLAGAIHLYAAYALIVMASLHALAALKHHFIDKDQTLVRMFAIHKGDNE